MSSPARFAGIRLADGVLPRHMGFYLAVVFFTSIFMGVINMSQPWVLTNVLKIPLAEHGVATSKLLFANECVMLALVATFGVLSDRIGRRAVYTLGFVLIGLGTALFTYATDLWSLIAFRVVCAMGTAALAAMMVAVVADYPTEEHRGRANGWQAFVAGLGAFFMFFVILQIPKHLAGGADPDSVDWVSIAHTWFFILVGFAAIGALLTFGIRRDAVVKSEHPKPFGQMAREAIAAAGKDPGLALAYGAAFVSRGDLAVAGTFVALWINKYGAEHGLNAAESAAKTGAIGGIAPLTATLFAPVAGFICDRYSRVGATALMMAIAAVAYNGMHFVSDPTGGGMMAMMALMGIAEIGAFVASQALVSQQAPADIRGSVTGFFGMCGAAGIMVGTVSGGWLFDWRPSGPFVLFGVLNVGLMVWALVVKSRVKPASVSI